MMSGTQYRPRKFLGITMWDDLGPAPAIIPFTIANVLIVAAVLLPVLIWLFKGWWHFWLSQ